MKKTATSPREHAKRIRAQRAAEKFDQQYKADPQRRVDWLTFLMMCIAVAACAILAARLIP